MAILTDAFTGPCSALQCSKVDVPVAIVDDALKPVETKGEMDRLDRGASRVAARPARRR